MRRRDFLRLAGILGLCPSGLFADAQAKAPGAKPSLLSAPLELAGIWGASPPRDVAAVLSRAREACLSGIALFSDRQPERLRVDNHTDGPPAIWLHNEDPRLAWIILDVGPLDWSKLAYQFGHELGHVLCNSWQRSANPGPPSQWLEEAMVEAFSIRGRGRLATSWERNPPFPGDAGFAVPLRRYRGDLIEKNAKPTELASAADLDAWFRAYRSSLEGGKGAPPGPAVLAILTLLESDAGCVEDLGAANRWPERTTVPLEAYLAAWEKSCSQIGAPGQLPVRLRSLLHVG